MGMCSRCYREQMSGLSASCAFLALPPRLLAAQLTYAVPVVQRLRNRSLKENRVCSGWSYARPRGPLFRFASGT